MLIVGQNKTTLLDYPGRVAATIFTGGCNFRCPFCHNGDLVLKPSSLDTFSEEEVLSFLIKRKNVLKGVCITGGEPALQEDLSDFIKRIKDIGYAVKLDTNGYMPKILQNLIDDKLLDYVAMDVKNCRAKYGQTVGIENFDIQRIEESIKILADAGINYEFRTTVVKELHAEEDLVEIGEWITGCPHYFLQQYQENENVIANVLNSTAEAFHGYDKSEMEDMLRTLDKLPGLTGKVSLRGLA